MGRRNDSEWEMPANGIFRILRSFDKKRIGPLEYDTLRVL